MKRAIIVGSNGQDGRFLSELLRERGYSVIGIDRSAARCPRGIVFRKQDILKFDEVADLIRKYRPAEIYYLAAFHHSAESLPNKNVELLRRSYAVHVSGLMNFLEAIRNFCPSARLFYAASSHIFGEPNQKIQDENTPINPGCIYGITKAAGLALCKFYRSRYGIFASSGILYNHESALRGGDFVSQKIIRGAIDIKRGRQKRLVLGDLGAVIDWGYAPDYVRAMHLILKNRVPDDFVVATGKAHTVLEFVQTVFTYLDLDWELYVREDRRIVSKQSFLRVGNPGKLRRATGWRPEVDFAGMIRTMIDKETESISFK